MLLAALEAAVDAGHSECTSLLLSHGARTEPPKRPATARKEARVAGAPFHWDRGLASQCWWRHQGLPSQSRAYRELEAQLTKHVLSAAPDAQLLETPLDRFARSERAHTIQFRKEQERKSTAREREQHRQAQIHNWNAKIESASLRRSARHSPTSAGRVGHVAEVWTAPPDEYPRPLTAARPPPSPFYP